MTGSPRRGLFLLLALGAVLFTSVALGVPGYSISDSSAIETPTQTVTFEGQTYTIDSVSRIRTDGSVTVSTTVPSGAAYDLNLRGPDNQIIVSERKTGNGSHTFSYFGSGEAGTYAASIQDGGNTVAVHPIVIAGYDMSVTEPDTVTAGETVTLEATVSELSVDKHSNLDRVEVIVGNDDVEVEETMTKESGDTYTATVDTDSLDPGTYNVYAVVRGDETVRQRDEVLGVSDTVDLTVEEQSTATESSGGTSGGTGGGGGPAGGATATSTSTETVTETSTATETETAVQTGTNRTTDTETATTDTVTEQQSSTQPTTASSSTQTEATTSADDVLDPSSPSPETSTGGSGPGFTTLVTVLAIGGSIFLARRRR
jgi:hypothetical protein